MTGPGPHTDDDVVVAHYIRDLLRANQQDLLLDDVLYGDHNMIPRASAAIVTAMSMQRQLAGVAAPGGRTQNMLNVQIQLLWSKVGDEETERDAVDARAKAVQDLIHSDTTLGGLIIHGFITNLERGTTTMTSGNIGNNSQFRAVIMQFVGTTKTYLTPSP